MKQFVKEHFLTTAGTIHVTITKTSENMMIAQMSEDFSEIITPLGKALVRENSEQLRGVIFYDCYTIQISAEKIIANLPELLTTLSMIN